MLAQLRSYRLMGIDALTGVSAAELSSLLNSFEVDFSDFRGQEYAKRALIVAAAGAHNVKTLWTISPNLTSICSAG